MTQVKNFHVFVEGRVQGVGYRRFAYLKAKSLGLKGWVRNLLDGRVELHVSFPSGVTKGQEEQFFEDLRRGPAFSMVRTLEVAAVDTPQELDFEIWPDEELERK